MTSLSMQLVFTKSSQFIQKIRCFVVQVAFSCIGQSQGMSGGGLPDSKAKSVGICRILLSRPSKHYLCLPFCLVFSRSVVRKEGIAKRERRRGWWWRRRASVRLWVPKGSSWLRVERDRGSGFREEEEEGNSGVVVDRGGIRWQI